LTYALDAFGQMQSSLTTTGSTTGTQIFTYDAASQGIARRK
jgi:hypothetical protein